MNPNNCAAYKLGLDAKKIIDAIDALDVSHETGAIDRLHDELRAIESAALNSQGASPLGFMFQLALIVHYARVLHRPGPCANVDHAMESIERCAESIIAWFEHVALVDRETVGADYYVGAGGAVARRIELGGERGGIFGLPSQ